MKYLELPCTRCGAFSVRPPSKSQLERQPVLVRCDECGSYSRYGVVSHDDGAAGYVLYKYGNGKAGERTVAVRRCLAPRHLRFTSAQIRAALDEVYGAR